MNSNGGSGNTRIAALLKREAALKAAIAEEKVRQQKANARIEAREFACVGEALVRYAGQSPEFKTMLRQVLPMAVTDEKARQFLTARGWL
jgi:hypothetical protein